MPNDFECYSKWPSNNLPLLPLPLPSRVHRLVARIHESVTLSLTKLAFTYASSIVRWVWKCPGHSGTMLSAVAVSARGGSNTTDTERLASLYIGPRQLPHYSRWPMANRIGRVPTSTLRGIVPRRRWPALRLEKLQLGIRRALESTYSNPSSPFADYICLLSFVSCDDAHPVWFFDRTRSAREFDTRRTSLKRYWKYLVVVWLVKFSEKWKEKFWEGKFALEVLTEEFYKLKFITVVRCRWRIVFWTEWKNKGLMTRYQGHVQKWFESFDRSLCKQCWRRRTKEKGKKNTLALYTDSFCTTREEVEKKKSSNSIEDYPLPW